MELRIKSIATVISMVGVVGGLWIGSPKVTHAQAQAAIPAKPQSSPTLFSPAAIGEPPQPWRVVGLPGGHKPLTRFDIVPIDGRHVLRVQTDRSYANLVHDLNRTTALANAHLNWRWRLDQPLLQADLSQRGTDDSPLKVCLLFDMPLENLGFIDRQLLLAARSKTTERLPAAILCYAWDHSLPAGTLINNAFTSRIRMIVMDSGEERLGQWVTHRRDIAADFRSAFGKESSTVPPLEAVLVGADSDNTAGTSVGYVGDITLLP